MPQPKLAPGEAAIGSRTFADLKQLAEELGANFVGIESGSLVFSMPATPQNERSMRETANTILQLLRTSPELHGILNQYPRVVLRYH
jgi:hypothetical protein